MKTKLSYLNCCLFHKSLYLAFAAYVLASSNAFAVTGTGDIGATILPNVLSLNEKDALKFCQDNNNYVAECDIIMANNNQKNFDILSTNIDQKNISKMTYTYNADQNYPIRIINFE